MADYLDPSLIVETFKTRRPDHRLKAAVTLSRLSQAGAITTQGKYDIRWQVELGGDTPRAEATTDVPVEDIKGGAIGARLDVGRYRISETFSILKTDLKEARSNGVGSVKQLLNKVMSDKVLAIVRRVNTLIYTGLGAGTKGTTGDGGMFGLNYVASINPSTGSRLTTINDTYAGISKAAVPTWDVLSVNNAGTPVALTRDTMLRVEEVMGLNEVSYDTILVHPSTSYSYNKVFYDIGGGAILNRATDNVGGSEFPRVDLGHTGRYYNGIPLTEDARVPVGCMYLLDMSQVELVQFDMSNEPSVANENNNTTTAVTSTEDTYGLQFVLSALPQDNPDAIAFTLRVYPQLVVYDRRSVTVLSDILVA